MNGQLSKTLLLLSFFLALLPTRIAAQSPSEQVFAAAMEYPVEDNPALSRIAEKSQNVVVASVASTTPMHGASGAVITRATLQVKQVLSGTAKSVLQVDQPGGILDGLDSREANIRYFVTGETIVLAFTSEGDALSPAGVWNLAGDGRIELPTEDVNAIRSIAMRHGFFAPKVEGATVYELSYEDFNFLMKALKDEAMGMRER